MKLREQLAIIPPTDWLMFVNAPAIIMKMTGTHAVGVRGDGTIRIQYEDGANEERAADDSILELDTEAIAVPELVSFVQAGRETAQ